MSIKKPEKPKFPILATVALIVASFLLSGPVTQFVALFIEPFFASIETLWLIIGVVFLAAWYACVLRPYMAKRKDYRLSEEDWEAYKRILQQGESARGKFEDSENKNAKIACPNCGSEDLRPAFTSDRFLIEGHPATAHYKLGMHFQCNHCKYKW